MDRRSEGSRRAVVAWVVCAAMLAACGPKTLQARMREGENLADEAARHLDEAEKALREQDANRAESELKDADRALKHPSLSTNPDQELLLARYNELLPRVAEVRAEKERQEIARRVDHRREVIGKSVKVFRKAIIELERDPADRASIDAARKAANEMNADLDWESELQSKDAEFKSYVEAMKIDLRDANKELAMAERAVEFVDGPVRDHDEALSATERAKAEAKLDQRLKLYQDASERYRRCNERALALIGGTPGLDAASITAGGKPATPALVAKSCDANAKGVQKLIASTQKALDLEAKKAAKAAAKAEAAAKRAEKKAAKKQAKR